MAVLVLPAVGVGNMLWSRIVEPTKYVETGWLCLPTQSSKEEIE